MANPPPRNRTLDVSDFLIFSAAAAASCSQGRRDWVLFSLCMLRVSYSYFSAIHFLFFSSVYYVIHVPLVYILIKLPHH